MCGGGSGGAAPEQKTKSPLKQKPAGEQDKRRSTTARYTPEPKTATMLTGGY